MAPDAVQPLSTPKSTPSLATLLWKPFKLLRFKKWGYLQIAVGSVLCIATLLALVILHLVEGARGKGILSNCGNPLFAQDCTNEFLSAGTNTGDSLINIAEGRPAEQSTTGQGALGLASHATDGNKDGNLRHGSCTHTADSTGNVPGSSNPWWRVDLGQPVPIKTVELWNREDCCSERLLGAEVWVSNTTATFLNGAKCQGTDEGGSSPGKALLRTCEGLTGKYVWVTLRQQNAYLSICEVVVLASADVLSRDTCFDASVMAHPVDFSDTSTKYLYYEKSKDFCVGASHKLWSFSCAFGEAVYLNRTFVLDFDWCLDAVHTGAGDTVKDFRLYYDMKPLEQIRFVPKAAFLCYLDKWKLTHKEDVKTLHVWNPLSAPFSSDLASNKSPVIYRHFSAAHFYYHVCEPRENHIIKRQWVLAMTPQLQNIVYAIKGAMGWDYDAVHVRRGDKAKKTALWPNLNRDTQATSILEKLPKFIADGRNLYIATDEMEPHFFDALSIKYKVFMLAQFTHLWAPGSAWYKAAEDLQKHLSRTDFVNFDAYMQAIVDYNILDGAKKKVESFNDLTSDPRHGTGTAL